MSFSTLEFTDGFISETSDYLDCITEDIIKLKNSPTDKVILTNILRNLHTIKGTSRMMNFLTIERLSHGLEDVLKGVHEGKYDLTDHIVQLTLVSSDCIKRCLIQIKEKNSDTIDIHSFEEVYKTASSGMFFSTEILEAENKGEDIVLDEENNDDFSLENIKSIRIDIERINEIIGYFDNIIIRQFKFKHQLEEYEKKGNDIPRQLKEELNLIENSIFETQHSILNLRMLPLSVILTPLKKEIEELAFSLNKNVQVNITNTEVLLDKAILENLKEILLHLVRNCIDHGIETPEQRESSGKNPKGTITIEALQISNHIQICVKDDGRGIQYEQIRSKAVSMFPLQAFEISTMGNKELQQYLYLPGFSTKSNATNLSGRGIGLDIVRTDMERIKGKIKIDSEENKGTTFELIIPISLATQQGLFVFCGNKKFMIPSHYVEEIIDSTTDDFLNIQSQNFIKINQQLIPVFYLSSILDLKDKPTYTSSLILVEYLETKIAIVVDSILRHENVIVNSLPPLLKSLKPLQGVVYDENYSIIPILNIPDIMQRLKNLYTYDIKNYKTKNERKEYTVLIVDDSITTKQIEMAIFSADGYIVETASDGIEALDILKSKHVDAIVSDIKMPRMDGMVLLNNVRRMEEYDHTPFIVVSGVYDDDLKNQFLSNGAQGFIVKSDFKRGNLLQIVKESING